MHPSLRADTEAADARPVLSGVAFAYNIDLKADGKWGLTNVLPSGAINFRSSFRMDFTVTRAQGLEYSIEEPNPAAGYLQDGTVWLSNP